MSILNQFVRRLFAWPLVILGTLFVHIGGLLIKAGAWTIDFDISDV
jgi:hypothetical protein